MRPARCEYHHHLSLHSHNSVADIRYVCVCVILVNGRDNSYGCTLYSCRQWLQLRLKWMYGKTFGEVTKKSLQRRWRKQQGIKYFEHYYAYYTLIKRCLRVGKKNKYYFWIIDGSHKSRYTRSEADNVLFSVFLFFFIHLVLCSNWNRYT